MTQHDLTARTESRRQAALTLVDPERQAALGQFLTPRTAANLIASMPRLPDQGAVRVLDPGAGAGSLTAALVDRLIREHPQVSIEIVALELDGGISTALKETLDDCARVARSQGVRLTAEAVHGDFLQISTGFERLTGPLAEPFDIVIMNPPYGKIAAGSAHRRAVAAYGAECPNIYAAFVAMGVHLLRPGGQIVAITPRSFANGAYFKQFRQYLFDAVALDRLHVYESRASVFSDTGVLQENVIFAATKGGARDRVLLSASLGLDGDVLLRTVPYSAVIDPADRLRVMRIAFSNDDTAAHDALRSSVPQTLVDVGLRASTGRVVDFRMRDYLLNEATKGAVPLVYPGNIRAGIINWPRAINKPQWFHPDPNVASKALTAPGRYVVVKRFSSKEERRRVVAGVWEPEDYGEVPIAFENHVNIIHLGGVGLDRDLALGTSLWLNSTVVDTYFRTVSGHTQVNATDLRSLPCPALDVLRTLGAAHPRGALPPQEEVDALVRRVVLDGAPS